MQIIDREAAMECAIGVICEEDDALQISKRLFNTYLWFLSTLVEVHLNGVWHF